MASLGKRQAAVMIWVAFGMGATLLTLVAVMPEVWNNSLAAHYQTQLQTGTAEQQLEAVKEAAKLHEAGLPVLVAAMNSRLPNVAETARQALLVELNSWELLPPASAEPRLTDLAETLRRNASTFEEPARSHAAEIAMRIFSWHGLENQPGHEALAKTCTEIMAYASQRQEYAARSTRSAQNPPQPQYSSYQTPPAPAGSVWPGATNRAAQPDPNLPRYAATSAPTPRETTWALTSDDMVRLAQYPGGGLPMRAGDAPPQQLASVPERRLVPVDVPAQPVASTPAWPPVPNVSANPATNNSFRSVVKTGGATTNEAEQNTNPFAGSAPQPSFSPAATNQPATLTPVAGSNNPFGEAAQLLRPLTNPNTAEAVAAKAQLAQLGWTPQQIGLAQMLQSPDPAVRRQLAESLPRMPGVDARPWLIALSQDGSADVRYAAAGIMATTNDPDLQRRVQDLGRSEADPRFVSLANKLKGPPTLPPANR